MGGNWLTPTCQPAWMSNSFASNPEATIPDEGTTVDTQVVCGIYTGVVGGMLYLDITHEEPTQLELTLNNPDEGLEKTFMLTETILNEGLNIRPDPTESANGTWRLEVKDTVSGTSGVLNGWALHLDSWPD